MHVEYNFWFGEMDTPTEHRDVENLEDKSLFLKTQIAYWMINTAEIWICNQSNFQEYQMVKSTIYEYGRWTQLILIRYWSNIIASSSYSAYDPEVG